MHWRSLVVNKSEFMSTYSAYSQKLFNFILWTTNNYTASQDILQNVFVKLWKCDNVPSNPDEKRKWLFAIARNACMDHFRSTSRSTRLQESLTRESESPQVSPHDGISLQILSELPEIERSILYLHLKMGYLYKEIAEMLDLNETAVRVRACRALKKLREIISKEDR